MHSLIMYGPPFAISGLWRVSYRALSWIAGLKPSRVVARGSLRLLTAEKRANCWLISTMRGGGLSTLNRADASSRAAPRFRCLRRAKVRAERGGLLGGYPMSLPV